MYTNARSFFDAEIANIESHLAFRWKYSLSNDYATANVSLEITELLKATKAENEALAEALECNNADHVCAMKELCAKMTQGKEEDKRALRSDIKHLTKLVMNLATQSLKRKAADSPWVTFKEEHRQAAHLEDIQVGQAIQNRD